jgi:hypothetical protein
MKQPAILQRRPLALVLAAPALALLLSACGGGSDDAPASRVTEVVPAGAATDAPTATAYTSSLAATPAAEADTLEPVALPDQLATDDSAEPA